jgi:hypothetical protein
MNDMMTISEQIHANEPIPVSEQVNNYLAELGLGHGDFENDFAKVKFDNFCVVFVVARFVFIVVQFYFVVFLADVAKKCNCGCSSC